MYVNNMSPVRREFFRRLGYIALGVIPIAFVWESKGPERFIGLAGFLFSMYQLILIVGMMQSLVDDFSPLRTYEKKTTVVDKVVYRLAGALFFLGLVFQVFEISKIDSLSKFL